MTLLLTVIAAIISTVVWYAKPQSKMKIGTLCLMYWGASLMWLVDAIREYADVGAEYFTPAAADMLNDAFLGMSVIVLGAIIWLAVLLIKDPAGRVKAMLTDKK